MKFPDIFEYDDCINFLKNFYEINKEADPSVTYRSLSYDLKWSTSYFHDVISGKKNLTVARALEFSSFAKFNSIKTERLIYLTILSSGTYNVKSFLLEKLNKEHNPDPHNAETEYSNVIDNYPETIEELRGDVTASALLKLLVWANGKIKKSEIPILLFLFPELNDDNLLNEKLDILVRNKNIEVISIDNESFIEVKILEPTIHFVITKENIHFSSHFSDNMSKILSHKKVTGYFNAGYLVISNKRFAEVKFKIHALRNWLLEVENETLSDRRTRKEEALLFQYDLNFAPIIDFKELGISDLGSWEEKDY